MHRTTVLAVFWAAFQSFAAADGATVSLDPASISVDGTLTPDDLRDGVSGAVTLSGTLLGLKDDVFTGRFDNLNALSFGNDRPSGPIRFSVDRNSLGLGGSAVHSQAYADPTEAAADVFISSLTGTNSLVVDETTYGLAPGFFADDVDALEIDFDFSTVSSSGDRPKFFYSFDALSFSHGSATTACSGLTAFANDVLVSDGMGVCLRFADGEGDVGLAAGDDIDALAVWDRGEIGEIDPGVDMALFSLSPFSTSTFTGGGTTGNWSPADILITTFDGQFALFASAASLGLQPADNIDAIDTLPEPSSGALSILALTILAARRRTARRRRAPLTRIAEKDRADA